MSRNQKLLVAVLGALVAHLLLLIAAVVLLGFSGVLAPQKSEAASEPEEVRILLSDLIPEAPEEEPGRQYLRTDPDQQSEIAPDSARFESDRDTVASTQMLPDPSAEAVEESPTIAGRPDMASLELRDRDFSEGDPIELPPPGSVAAQASAAGVPATRTDAANPTTAAMAEAADTRDGKADDGTGEAEAETDLAGDADETLRPDAMLLEETVEAETEASFADPLAADDAPQVGRDEGGMDRAAASDREDAEIGSPTDASVAAKPGDSSQEGDRAADAPPTGAGAETPMAASTPGAPTDLPAFVPTTRANEISGTLTNLGNKAALDVEATALGAYKKEVVGAIERTWHQFRLSNMDDVTAGNLRLRFRVDSKGQVRNLKILRNEANIGMTEFTLKAILTADIPVMPEDVAEVMGSEGLIMTYTVLVVY